MRGYKTPQKAVKQIIRMRETGHSLDEIIAKTKISRATVFGYMRNVPVLPAYQEILRNKAMSPTLRSQQDWIEAKNTAKEFIRPPFSKSIYLIIAACLYWAEGSKLDFGLSNTDAGLIKTFLESLYKIGIKKEDLKVTIRIYEDINKKDAIKYWATVIGIPTTRIANVNVLFGKKKGKLKYGMCRVRIRKGGRYLKLLKSAYSELHTILASS